jgi:feruloyl esterase
MKIPKIRVLVLPVRGRIGQFFLGFVGFASLYLALGSKAKAAADCANLANLVIENTTITSASLIPAGVRLPEYCRVQGHVDTEIGFEVRLPTGWNGKFYFQGNGGFAGNIPVAGPGLVRGYAVAATDTGHQGALPGPAGDASWALNNPERQVNFAYRAVHVVTGAAKQIVQAFYGHLPERSYFEGCSTGGRQGLMEAQRYPTDFNGIIAGAPALDQTGAVMAENWNAQALHVAPIPMDKVSLIASAVLEECDARDGLRDGLISDPRRCRFDPGRLQCPAADAPDCLTPEQVRAVRMIYSGPVNSEGERVYPGFPQGHEDGADGWPLWITGNGFVPPRAFSFQDQFLRFFIFDPTFDWLTFNFDTDPARLAPTAEFLNATDPDLSVLKANGGKLIMWQGWSDPNLTPFRLVPYFLATAFGDGDDEDRARFLRLFMAPGVHHCGGGRGPNTFDLLTALENWVEGGVAPDRIIASHSTGGVVDRTRPLCPYPLEARYVGTGSIDDAVNFVCGRRGDDDEQ